MYIPLEQVYLNHNELSLCVAETISDFLISLQPTRAHTNMLNSEFFYPGGED